ncbi:TRAP transporter small permease [Halomonas sp. MCCC 1A11036]|uniref:TRAP transporter small permease protein n=1 Tax=Billgrantia zhangzhouensis TaxID=2733481 RepID=A0ABS9ACN8_9GAMM|nr:TRAP transporter small permease [Halomonas zhangzhouensis]MCE8019484.1 TRAP transporter small permease [Halomonas zhangzhouensis]
MKRVLDYILGTVVFVILAVIVASVTWQVVSRYLLGTPSTSTSEIARLLFMWLALLGGAYTFGQARHLAIDLLPQTLKGVSRRFLNTIILLTIASFAYFVMVRGGWAMVSRTLMSGQITPSLRMPMGYVYGAIPASGVLVIAYCVIFLGRVWLNPAMQGGFSLVTSEEQESATNDTGTAPESQERVH